MKLVVAGTPDVAVPTLRALAASEHEVVGVITREDAPVGRKRIMTPSPVAGAAESLGIEVYRANRLDDRATAWVESLGADLGVVVAYGGLLRTEMLRTPKLGWINLHFSHLPEWRGAAPVQRAIMAGDETLGMTVFRLVEALDAGDILTRGERRFAPYTTAGDALEMLAVAGVPLVLEAIDMLAQDPSAGIPQEGAETYAHKLTRDDGKLTPQDSAARVLSHWAGVTPEPGAFFLEGEQTLKVIAMKPYAWEGSSEAREPGTVSLIQKCAVLFTRDGAVELIRVQPAGKQAMDGAAWLRGRGGKATLV